MSANVFPASKWGRVRLGLLLLIFLVLGCIYRDQTWFLFSRTPALWNYLAYSPQEGDVVFQSLPHGDLVDAIEGVTHSPYSHCGVVLRDEKGRWVVIEAIGVVHETPLFSWIFRGRGGAIAAFRLKPDYASRIPEFKKDLLAYAGFPYDFSYDMSKPGSVYCSDLVFLAFQQAADVRLGTPQRLGELDWQGHRSFIMAEANGRLPLQQLIITPASLARAPQLHRVF